MREVPKAAWAVGGVLVVGFLALAALHEHWFTPRHGPDLVAHLISWPSGCDPDATIAIEKAEPTGGDHRWQRDAVEQVDISCYVAETFSAVTYTRFPSRAVLQADLRRHPPRSRYCVAGAQVVTDGLGARFPDFCHKFHGHLFSKHPG